MIVPRLYFCLTALVLALGCGGDLFNTTTDFAVDGATEVDAAATSDVQDAQVYDSGDSAPRGAGGASHGSGGAPQATGGSFRGSGGSPHVEAGSGGGTCDGGVLFTHSNGAGQTWTDCIPINTYDIEEATKACRAWCAVNGCSGCWEASVCGDVYILGALSSGAATATGWAIRSSDVVRVTLSTSACAPLGSWR